jgi:hypothetical protein
MRQATALSHVGDLLQFRAAYSLIYFKVCTLYGMRASSKLIVRSFKLIKCAGGYVFSLLGYCYKRYSVAVTAIVHISN